LTATDSPPPIDHAFVLDLETIFNLDAARRLLELRLDAQDAEVQTTLAEHNRQNNAAAGAAAPHPG